MPELKQELYEIAREVFVGTPVLFAYFYGSHATGLPHQFSDLDIGIFVGDVNEKECLELELSLGLSIDEKLDHRVQSDVRILKYLPLVFVGRILEEGVLIYSRDEDKRIDFETRVRKAYFDFLPVIHQHREAYRAKLLSESGHDTI